MISCMSQAYHEQTFRWAHDKPGECMISYQGRQIFLEPISRHLCVLKIFYFHVFWRFIRPHMRGCRDRVITVDHMTQFSQWNVQSKQEVTRKLLPLKSATVKGVFTSNFAIFQEKTWTKSWYNMQIMVANYENITDKKDLIFDFDCSWKHVCH